MFAKITIPCMVAMALAGCNTTSGGPGKLNGERSEVVDSDLIPGHHLTYGPFARVDDKCRVIGQARARVTQRPAHGTAEIGVKKGEIVFGDEARLSRCNNQPARATTITYRSVPDHYGEDQFRFRLVFPDGETRDVTVNVHRRRE